jgi:WD40 repeat protein
MWDLRADKPVAFPIKWDNEVGVSPVKIYATQISQCNGRFLLAGGSGTNEARLYDLLQDTKVTPTVLAYMKNFRRACYTVDFSNQGDMCAASGGDGIIRVIDIFKRE